jgi:hypothetical protein
MSNETPQTDSEDMLQIPSNVHVPCPLYPGKLRRLEHCVACEHGARPLLVDRFDDSSKQPFSVRYMLRCKHPRNLQLAEVDAT